MLVFRESRQSWLVDRQPVFACLELVSEQVDTYLVTSERQVIAAVAMVYCDRFIQRITDVIIEHCKIGQPPFAETQGKDWWWRSYHRLEGLRVRWWANKRKWEEWGGFDDESNL